MRITTTGITHARTTTPLFQHVAGSVTCGEATLLPTTSIVMYCVPSAISVAQYYSVIYCLHDYLLK